MKNFFNSPWRNTGLLFYLLFAVMLFVSACNEVSFNQDATTDTASPATIAPNLDATTDTTVDVGNSGTTVVQGDDGTTTVVKEDGTRIDVSTDSEPVVIDDKGTTVSINDDGETVVTGDDGSTTVIIDGKGDAIPEEPIVSQAGRPVVIAKIKISGLMAFGLGSISSSESPVAKQGATIKRYQVSGDATADSGLVGITPTGNAQPVAVVDASGDPILTVTPKAIDKANARFMAVTLDITDASGDITTEVYLVDVTTDNAYPLSKAGYLPVKPVKALKNARKIQSKGNRLYYKEFSGKVVRVDVTDPLNPITTDYITQADNFLIDQTDDSNSVYRKDDKLYAKSSTMEMDITTSNTSGKAFNKYWSAKGGISFEAVLVAGETGSGDNILNNENGKGWIKRVRYDANGDITTDVQNPGAFTECKTPPSGPQPGTTCPGFGILYSLDNCDLAEFTAFQALICDTSYNGGDLRVYTLGDIPKGYNLRAIEYNFREITAVGYDDQYFYVAGRKNFHSDDWYHYADGTGPHHLQKILVSDMTATELLTDDTYHIKEIITSGGKVLFSGTRLADSVDVLMELDQTTDTLTTLSETTVTNLIVIQ